MKRFQVSLLKRKTKINVRRLEVVDKLSIITVLAFAMSLWCANDLMAELMEGLVGYWSLDGNGEDMSGNANHAKLKNGAKWVANGQVNGAVEVDGFDGHVVVSDTFYLLTDTITVGAWINGWKTIDWSGIVVGRSETSFWMGVAANNTLTYGWNNDSVYTWGWQGAPSIPQNEWAFVAIAIQPEKATSYIYHEYTGKLDSEVNDIPHIQQTVMNLKFGVDECCSGRFFKGLIDEVMVYDRTLNDENIKKLATIGVSVESAGKLAITWAALKRDRK